jgi:hypothetical protein
MDANWRSSLCQQLGAAIDMLGNAVAACPDELWRVRLWDDAELPAAAEFWYIAYHTLFWLDLYLTGAVEGFEPPAPFNRDELDPAGLLPETPYTREELQTYLAHGRRKCRTTIDALTDEQASRHCYFPWGEVSFAGLLLDNMRHVQEHAAQLNLILGQKTGWSPRWVAQARLDAASAVQLRIGKHELRTPPSSVLS